MVATTLALRGSFEGQGFPPLSVYIRIRIRVYVCVWRARRLRGVRRGVAGVEVLVNKDEARGRSEYAWVAGGVCQGWREPGAQYL